MPLTGNRTLTDRDSALFIQPDGPNTQTYVIECAGVGDIAEDFGSTELIQAFGPGGEYQTKGAKVGAPGVIPFDLMRLVTRDRTWLEEMRERQCFIPILLKQQDCGVLSDLANYKRVIGLEARLKTFTFAGFKAIGNEGEKEAMFNTAWEALPPLSLTNEVEVTRMTQSNANQVNDLTFNTDEECDSNCAATYGRGQKGVAVFNSTTSAKPKVRVTTDYGVTWADTSADPGAVDDDLASVIRFQYQSAVRIIAGRTAVGSSQGAVFYSDDNGATWTTVNIGGAAAGHGAVLKKSLFVFPDNPYFVWLAGAAGYIYKSTDAGASWTAKESGVVHTGNYNFINFADTKYGIAGGAADIIAITNNGGDSWSAATATGSGSAINCGARLDKNRMWVGTAGGALYYSNDGGSTWTQRTGWSGSGSGQVKDMMWLDPLNGIIAKNTSGPVGSLLRTIDGGYSWKVLSGTPTNAGINAVWMSGLNRQYAGGQPQGSLGVILRAQAQLVG